MRVVVVAVLLLSLPAGLVVFDEVHMLPAKQSRLAISSVRAHCKLGLSVSCEEEERDQLEQIHCLVLAFAWLALVLHSCLACTRAWLCFTCVCLSRAFLFHTSERIFAWPCLALWRSCRVPHDVSRVCRGASSVHAHRPR